MATSTSSGDGDARARTQQSPLASQRAKQEGEQSGRRTWFPLGAKDGWNQWWASITPAVAEHKVLSFIPYLQKPPTHTQTGSAPPSITASSTNVVATAKAQAMDGETVSTSLFRETSVSDPHGPRRWHSSLVKLAGKDRGLNEFSVERVGETVENNLVILHGYGAGLGFFYKNFEPLSRRPQWRLYALDLLGMGRSTRPPFRIHAKDRPGKIAEAENWFIDALEEWRISKKIDRFTLCGHSLGGYMAVAYALKYPGHLNKLILASPVGIPEDPYAVSAAMPEPSESTLQAEFSEDQSKTAANARSNAPASAKSDEPQRRPLPKWLTYLWDANVSPFSFVRWSGPLGPRLVSGWTSRRFSQLPPEQAQALHDYAYSLFRQRGSGEYALSYILAPGAFARSPLIRRIGAVGRQWVPISGEMTQAPARTAPETTPTVSADQQQKVREAGVPVVLMYGENDWMDVAGGYAAQEKLRAARSKALENATAEQRRRDMGDAKVLVVRGAGHHVYLDGADEFNDMILDEMKDVERREQLRKSWEN